MSEPIRRQTCLSFVRLIHSVGGIEANASSPQQSPGRFLPSTATRIVLGMEENDGFLHRIRFVKHRQTTRNGLQPGYA